MALELNGTTGVSLVQDGVVTAADLASGAITSAALPAGSVLQVAQNTTTSTTNTSVTSQWHTITDYNVTITPSSNTNKILLLGSCNLYADADSDGQTATGQFRALRSGVAIWTTTNAILARGGQQHFSSVDIKYLDSPSTTSALTYTFQFYINSTNRAVLANSIDFATIIALEIAA
jgi:hypothetical protein